MTLATLLELVGVLTFQIDIEQTISTIRYQISLDKSVTMPCCEVNYHVTSHNLEMTVGMCPQPHTYM